MKLNNCNIHQLARLHRKAIRRARGCRPAIIRKGDRMSAAALNGLRAERQHWEKIQKGTVDLAIYRASNPQPAAIRDMLNVGALSPGKARVLRSFYRQTEIVRA